MKEEKYQFHSIRIQLRKLFTTHIYVNIMINQIKIYTTENIFIFQLLNL
jgi:hypothetical protein